MMIVEKDKVVSLAYKLTVNESNELVEEVKSDNPLTFVFGQGSLLPRFEENVSSLKEGDPFEFLLVSDEAYGPVNNNAVTDLPISIFEIEGEKRDDLLKLGNVIPMRDAQGRRIDGKVIEITNDTVKMDFNHPMAGKDLNFKGHVVAIRDASPEELEFGLGGGSCGCGDSSCGTDDHGCDSGSCGGCGC